MKGLTPEQAEMMQKIFARYHSEHIEPTSTFVAQACFDIGWLQGLISLLAAQVANHGGMGEPGLNRPS